MTSPEPDSSIRPSGDFGKIAALLPSAPNLAAAIALGVALLGISSGSIFLVIAGREMAPNQIALNRLFIAAIVFAIWNGLRSVAQPATALQPATFNWRDIGLLVGAGGSFAAFLVVLAWSFAHTSVANAALLTHLMPIFTALGAWLGLGRRFSAFYPSCRSWAADLQPQTIFGRACLSRDACRSDRRGWASNAAVCANDYRI